MLRFFRIYGMSVVYSLVILYLSIAPKMPDFDILDFDLKDKVMHGGAYVLLSMIVCYELYRQRYAFDEKKMFLWGILYPIVYGGVIELLQERFFPPRTGEWSDWLADIIGTLIGFFLAKWLCPKFFEPEKKGLSCR